MVEVILVIIGEFLLYFLQGVVVEIAAAFLV
jgi:hypothetical protein